MQTIASRDVEQITEIVTRDPEIRLAIVFGSAARQSQRSESDVDVAILSRETMDVESRMELIAAIAGATGRSVDLVDLHEVGEPLLGEILTRGVRILVRDELAYADLIRRHLLDAADFRPLRDRILEERRTRWTDE